jgi:DNA polymerase/3'-5' exonuclease PolX
VPIELNQATKWAEQIKEHLKPYCTRIEIVGSIRRKRPQVGDIDLVILPKDGNVDAVKQRCLKRSPQVLMNGAVNFIFMAGPVQVDIFFASTAVPELFGYTPGNWGSLMVCRTGSKQFNIWLCARAKEQGGHWDPYSGFWNKDRVQIPCEEEADVFKAIGVDWIEPIRRER